MKVLLQDFVPYDQSVRWKIHDAYYAACGGAAWDEGDIPQFATSNFAMARQRARLIVALVDELVAARKLPARGPIGILEVGSGSGAFALNFLRALDTGCGEAGKRLYKRVRYILSDYSETTVRDAIARQVIRPHVEAGRLVPATFDFRKPGLPLDLRGDPIAFPIVALIANYVACVSPLKILKKQGDQHFEMFTKLEAELPDGKPIGPEGVLAGYLEKPTTSGLMASLDATADWRPCVLEETFTDPLHAKVCRETLEPHENGTLTYPYAFIDVLRAMRKHLVPGGLALVSDYGTIDDEDVRGKETRKAQHYGNVLNHGVEFCLFDHLCPALGLAHVRTRSALSSVHTVAIRYQRALPRSFKAAFDETHVQCEDGEDLLDFSEAARKHFTRKEFWLAARLYERCVALDPGSADLRFRFGEAAYEAGFQRVAVEQLELASRLPPDAPHDFLFLLGRAYFKLDRYAEAIGAFTHSLLYARRAETYTNLGLAHEAIGDNESAIDAYRSSLELDPDEKTAKEQLAGVLKEESVKLLAAKAPRRGAAKKARPRAR